MGINASFIQFMGEARGDTGPFGRVVTVGRQKMTIPAATLAAVARRLGIGGVDTDDLALDLFAERVLIDLLGAGEVTAIDYSAFEGASIVHDLNEPLPATWHEAFDTLIDGGAMEHIFDVRQVFTNYVRLIRPGGSIFIAVPANNQLGHGFYQFSPELFYRVFTPANGLEIARCYLVETPLLAVELSATQNVYATIDPDTAGGRVYLCNSRPVTVLVHARKVRSVEPFARPPLQSDYRAPWSEHAADGPAREESRRSRPFRFLGWRDEIRRRRRQRKRRSFANHELFRPHAF